MECDELNFTVHRVCSSSVVVETNLARAMFLLRVLAAPVAGADRKSDTPSGNNLQIATGVALILFASGQYSPFLCLCAFRNDSFSVSPFRLPSLVD